MTAGTADESCVDSFPRDWSRLIGQQRIAGWFAAAIRRRRLGGSFLFIGPPGVGKTTAALLLARTLFCERSDPLEMRPCGRCPSCQQVLAGTHPDLVQVAKPKDRTFIPLDLLVGPPESRMQQGFCHDVRLRPIQAPRKEAVIHDADFLNEEGANCLLKTLEEPPANSIIVLIGTSEQRQLPTIRSRCQIIRFPSPRGTEAVDLLKHAHGVDAQPDQIAEAVDIAGGDMRAAARLMSGEASELRDGIVSRLADDNPDPVALSRIISSCVSKAGKEPARRRDALRDVFSIAVQHYRSQLRSDAGRSQVCPRTLSRLDRSVRALREVDRSANQSTLIECYAADIAAGITGDRGGIG